MTTTLTPFGYTPVLGITSQSILPVNPSRKGVIFFNASATATVAVCPAFAPTGVTISAIINGPGSITIVPGGLLALPQPGWPADIGIGCQFNGIASAPSTNFTIWEF